MTNTANPSANTTNTGLRPECAAPETFRNRVTICTMRIVIEVNKARLGGERYPDLAELLSDHVGQIAAIVPRGMDPDRRTTAARVLSAALYQEEVAYRCLRDGGFADATAYARGYLEGMLENGRL